MLLSFESSPCKITEAFAYRNWMAAQQEGFNRVSTGIMSLDKILRGGLPAGELYVVNGAPGSGKTTLALHFLQAGVQAGEKVLCLALSQRVDSLKQTARSVGIDVSRMTLRDSSTIRALQEITIRQTVFDTSEVELSQTMQALTEVIETEQPKRVVFDGISYLRMLSNDPLTYRHQIFMLRDYMAERSITVLLTDTEELVPGDNELVAMAHGVISLSVGMTRHGSDHRYLRVSKIRGSDYEPGKHDMEISDWGVQVYRSHRAIPILSSLIPRQQNPICSSGLPALDKLVGGGLLAGTTCLLVGPSGTGKTSLATTFVHSFAQQGSKASIYLFDELADTFIQRSAGLGMDVEQLIEQDRIRLHELSFGTITPGKFAYLVEQDLEEWGTGMVVIDTLTGYLNSMPSETRLIAQMHELMMRLNRQGILTFLVVAQHGVVAPTLEVPVDVSYLADTVLLLRHFEAEGMLRQAVSVYKKRYGPHEKGIRELKLQPGSIQIGSPLNQFTGILSGTPRYLGEQRNLIGEDD